LGRNYLRFHRARIQAAKTLDIEKRRMFGLEDNPRLTAKKAKDMEQYQEDGELRSDWLKVNIGIMRELLY